MFSSEERSGMSKTGINVTKPARGVQRAPPYGELFRLRLLLHHRRNRFISEIPICLYEYEQVPSRNREGRAKA